MKPCFEPSLKAIRIPASFALLFPLLVFASCGGSSGSSFDSGFSAQFQQILDEKRAADGSAGVAMLVRCDDGRQWAGASGVAQADPIAQAPDEQGHYDWQGEPLDAHLIFRIGSLTKTFTSALVLRLAEEGRLALDDPLEQWLPGVITNSSLITIRQLLNHTSGVADFNEAPGFSESRAWTPSEIIALVADAAPQFEPGQSFKYTNTNYVLLGMLAEQAAGQPYETLVQTMLIDRLGLQHTYVPTTPEFPEAHAYGYEQQSDGSFRDTTNIEPTAPWAAGSMLSNVFDLAAWIEAFVDGPLLAPEIHAEQHAFIPSLVNPAKGYGLGLIRMPDGRLGHSGSLQGFFSGAWRINSCTVVALSNSRTASDTAEDVSAAATELLLGEQTE